MSKKKTTIYDAPKLDIGCGANKKPGFFGIDSIAFEGVDAVVDITQKPWPFADNSVEEFYSSHVVEHLTWPQRVIFFNELYRILKPGAKGQIIIPHWASMRYYGDPTHQAPMSEFALYYLSKEWRLTQKNAPHTDSTYNPNGYSCDFTDITWGHTLHPLLQSRNTEYQQNALTFYKDAAQDLVINLNKK